MPLTKLLRLINLSTRIHALQSRKKETKYYGFHSLKMKFFSMLTAKYNFNFQDSFELKCGNVIRGSKNTGSIMKFIDDRLTTVGVGMRVRKRE